MRKSYLSFFEKLHYYCMLLVVCERESHRVSRGHCGQGESTLHTPHACPQLPVWLHPEFNQLCQTNSMRSVLFKKLIYLS